MGFRAPVILILLSSIVILSYLFNMFSKKTNIPSVLLLIATGIGIKYGSAYYGIIEADVNKLVKILGATGLIMIVLEAALDLKLGRDKLKLISDSFFSALFIFLISAFGISFLVMNWLEVAFENAFIYAVPLSIISSAIVIPSTSHLREGKREFIVYESSFSDILGILVFNYMLMSNILSFSCSEICGEYRLCSGVVLPCQFPADLFTG
jgi:NhaP-type Na+/H+ and K+/H+ antiporter